MLARKKRLKAAIAAGRTVSPPRDTTPKTTATRTAATQQERYDRHTIKTKEREAIGIHADNGWVVLSTTSLNRYTFTLTKADKKERARRQKIKSNRRNRFHGNDILRLAAMTNY
jgi:hypothetical protein